jgi:MFS family permease
VTAAPPESTGSGVGAVLANRPFLLLWLSQAATQIGGNMVLYGLTVIIVSTTDSNSAVSALILSFLVPAVVFSALAGVYVDRMDRRVVLIATNLIRAIAFIVVYLAGDFLPAILLLTFFVSTVTVFFAPAEAAMIPVLIPRHQLMSANSIFTITLNGAFAIGFALLGPLVVTIAGPETLILLVAALYFAAAAFCWTLPPAPAPRPGDGLHAKDVVGDAERAVGSTFAQLREGLSYIRENRAVSWSLVYLGIASSLIGVLGVLGPDFAQETLGLEPKDFVVVVLPLGAGIVMGILLLNSYGRLLPRRRVIEVGLVALGAMLSILSVAGPISRFLQQADRSSDLLDLSAVTSLLAVVVLIAFIAGVAYAVVAIPAQTQLQEDLPEEVRGRVFGVLNMLISVASFLPIIIVGPISDLIGTTSVILLVAVMIGLSGIASIIRRGPLQASDWQSTAGSNVVGGAIDPVGGMPGSDPTTYEDVDAWQPAPAPDPVTAPRRTEPAPAPEQRPMSSPARRRPQPVDETIQMRLPEAADETRDIDPDD